MVEHITLGVKYKTNTGQIVKATGGTVLTGQTELLNYNGAPRIMLVECIVYHGDGITEKTYVLNTQLEEIEEPKLTAIEQIELSFYYLEHFRWLVRNEIGGVVVFKEKPVRHNSVRNYTGGGYDHWINDNNFPIEHWGMSKDLKKGEYDFIKWEDEPMAISKLLINANSELIGDV